MCKRLLSIASVLLIAYVCSVPVETAQIRSGVLQARRAAQKTDPYGLAPETTVDCIVVKFQEGTKIRLREGRLGVLERTLRERRDMAAGGLNAALVLEELSRVQAILDVDPHIKRIDRVFSALSEGVLARWKESGETESSEQLADLDLYYDIELIEKTRYIDVKHILEALNDLRSVEIAYAESSPVLAGRTSVAAFAITPNFQSQQGYLNAAPQGIDALYAWTITGGRGSNVKIVDVEFAWQDTHEDFPPLFYGDPPTSSTQAWRSHGTAAVGIVAAKNNGFGVTGIASSSLVGLQSHWNNNAKTKAELAIALAASQAGPGGIVLIELQTTSQPRPANSPPCCAGWEGSCGSLPLESKQAVFDAIKTATANGITVIEPAGNGSSDLDDLFYGGIFSRAVRDSGAIMVAARDSVTGEPTCFTNWGTRIDVNGWGNNVATLGCNDVCPGDLYNGGSENTWYTKTFDGTSSAAPIVAGAAASLQGIAQSRLGRTMIPGEIRHRLMSNATWVFSASTIGPMPNLRGAIGQLLNGNRVPTANPNLFTIPRNTVLSVFFNQLLANDSDPDGDALSVDAYDLITQHGTNDFGHIAGFNYTPAPGFVGTDVFSYRIVDARGLMAIGKVTIQVQ